MENHIGNLRIFDEISNIIHIFCFEKIRHNNSEKAVNMVYFSYIVYSILNIMFVYSIKIHKNKGACLVYSTKMQGWA